MPASAVRDDAWWDRFKQLLDEQTAWPAPYLFKFIVPVERVPELQALFPDYDPSFRASSKGNFVSLSMTPVMGSSAEVVSVYEAAGRVEGVIML